MLSWWPSLACSGSAWSEDAQRLSKVKFAGGQGFQQLPTLFGVLLQHLAGQLPGEGLMGLAGSAPCPALSACTKRACISAAALRVKVMATMASGTATRASNVRMRWVSNSVLPLPAGASTRKD